MWKGNLLVWEPRNPQFKHYSSRNSGGNFISSNTIINSQGGERILLDDPNYLTKLRIIQVTDLIFDYLIVQHIQLVGKYSQR